MGEDVSSRLLMQNSYTQTGNVKSPQCLRGGITPLRSPCECLPCYLFPLTNQILLRETKIGLTSRKVAAMCYKGSLAAQKPAQLSLTVVVLAKHLPRSISPDFRPRSLTGGPGILTIFNW